ncbi:Nramp family divalent metal transporter [Caenimonas sp. DR4.4]|uniref:Nramp family divalent metal transporter n=2 Tax=Caenimonas aquaedulcis TaxID=2793270 RepID=A0A931MG89_9BURK|nr:Nramp family divalent metal transporter [Caenimonas aquaedulcis]MBG9387619.1 Nramp family divalent metal transporter [Caenimonas aquaedulcis]
MTALGGFVDIGELVFAIEAGAKFGFALLWVVVLGTVGIAIFGEMSGRIAAVLKKPAFEAVRDRFGFGPSLGVLVASNLVNILTCAAEVGGLAIILQLVFGANYRLMLLAAAGLLLLTVFLLPFRWIERVFGLAGLTLLVYAVAAVKAGPDWGDVARGLVPQLPAPGMPGLPVYAYYIVGLLSSILMPYEIYFYSSGGIEDKWTPKDLPVNKLTAGVGFTLGGLLTMALIVVGAAVFLPQQVDPQRLSSVVMGASVPLGHVGFLFALAGIFFAVGGAAVETALSAGYNVAQFFGLPWGKSHQAREVPLFTVCWMAAIVLGTAIAMGGANPIQVVEYSVIFAVVVLPFTYYPILKLADDRDVMGRHVNSPVIRVLGWAYFALICAVALAAIPLLIATHMGQA